MTLSRKNAVLSQVINVSDNAIGDTILIPSGNIVNLSGIFTANSGNFINSLRVNGTGVSISGHTHLISDITNFNISGGYDISVTNNSGIYTIASTNLAHADSQQPQGFINRTDSRISVSGNVFRIEPTGSSYSYYNKGVKVVKTSGDSLTIPNLTQINYIHFDTATNQISNKTTRFDFDIDIPIAYVAWNSGVGPSGQMTFFAEERHGIVMDTSTHKWIHNTFGVQYVDGLSISDYVLGGNGSSNSHATISIGNGTLYQEDIEINITDSSSADPFCQELSPIAQIPVYYHEGTTGQWVKNTATNYPVKYDANGPQYNLLNDGTWTIPYVSPGGQTRYFAVWILATNQIDDPIISIMGQRIDSNQGSAESNNSWSDVNLTNLPLSEVKPLYRLIFAGDSDYTNVPKCTLLSILDIRVAVISTIAGVTQNDHGNLFGLGDDDHSQYLHVDNARTVNAIHNFANGLTVNGTVVSVSGHTHSSSNITDFASSVSGLLPSTLVYTTGNQTISGIKTFLSESVFSGGLSLFASSSSTFGWIPIFDGSNTPDVSSQSLLYITKENFKTDLSLVSTDIGDFNDAVVAQIPTNLVYTTGNQTISGIKTFNDTIFASTISGTDPVTISSSTAGMIINDITIFLQNNTHVDGYLRLNNETADTIAIFNNDKDIVSLTSPTLTELSYVSGVSSNIQTQLDSKQATLTNPVTGTGVANHIPYWSSTSGLLADSNQLIWDSTSNRLGIGTSSPASQLHVIGSGIFTSGLFIPNNVSIRSSTSAGSEFNIIRCDTADNVRIERPSASSDTYIGSSTAFILKGNDRVGMGHVSPLNRLAVNGAATIGANYNVSAPTNGLLVEGSVGIGTSTPSGQLHVIGTGLFSGRLGVGISGFPTWISQAVTPHTFVHISGASGLFPDVNERAFGSLLRLNSGGSTNNPRIDFRIGGPGNYDNQFFISRNGTDVIGVDNANKMFLPNGFSILNPTNNGEGNNASIYSFNDAASWITLDNNTRSMIIGYRGKGPGDQYIDVASSGRLKIYNYYSEVATFDNRGRFGVGTTTPNAQIHVIGSGIFSSGISTNGDIRSSGSFIAGSGSALLPSFEFINDSDTGLFSPASNVFSISTSGIERVRINNVGNVGINTTSYNFINNTAEDTAKLSVNGTLWCHNNLQIGPSENGYDYSWITNGTAIFNVLGVGEKLDAPGNSVTMDTNGLIVNNAGGTAGTACELLGDYGAIITPTLKIGSNIAGGATLLFDIDSNTISTQTVTTTTILSSSNTTLWTISIPPSSAKHFNLKASVYNATNSATASWNITGLVKRVGTGNAAIVGTNITDKWNDATFNTSTLTITASSTNIIVQASGFPASSSTVNMSITYV